MNDTHSHTDISIKQVTHDAASESHNREKMHVQLTQQTSEKVDEQEPNAFGAKKETGNMWMPDAQVIRAKVYLSLPSAKANAHFVRELRLRIKEVQRALAVASKYSDLPKNATE